MRRRAGKLQLNRRGEAIYGERDRVDLAALRELGVPFWLAGGYGTAENLRYALAAGAAGIQVGTAFAFCAESGLRDDYKRALLRKAAAGVADVFTDPLSSPTGFPFKAAQLEGSLSEQETYAARPRICDLGFMREAHWTAGGVIEYRCPAEPEAAYLAKGGRLETTVGKKCLCNASAGQCGIPADALRKPPGTGLGYRRGRFDHPGAFSAAGGTPLQRRGRDRDRAR